MKKISPLFFAFLSGTVMLFLLFIAGIFFYSTLGSMQGWPSVKWDVFGILIFETIMKSPSFEMRFGAGILLFACLGGLLNAGLASLLNRSKTA